MKPKVGRNFTSERGEGVKGEVKNISLHWLQGIFETVPNKGMHILREVPVSLGYSPILQCRSHIASCIPQIMLNTVF